METEKPERLNKPDQTIKYAADSPYPPICAQHPEPAYAQAMLDNVGGRGSEMSTISFYFYNHLVTYANEEITQFFHSISIVEMHHLEIFASLARELGADSRLWTRQKKRMVWWSPGYMNYSANLSKILLDSIEGEKSAIKKYTFQSEHISDANVVENLNRIILDELLHVRILTEMYEKYFN